MSKYPHLLYKRNCKGSGYRRGVVSWTVSPQILYAEIITLSISECDINLEISPYRGNEVKMRSLEWVLTQDDQCPYNNGKSGRRHAERDVWKPREKTAIRKPRRQEHGTDSPSQPSEEPTLQIPLSWTFRLQNGETINSCLNYLVHDTVKAATAK